MKTASLKKLHHADGHILTLAGLMAAVCAVMLLLNPGSYFTAKNLRSMVFQFPEYGILSLGMMLCMISGGIDLSLVGIMNLSGVIAAQTVKGLVPDGDAAAQGAVSPAVAILLAAFAAMAAGAVCGAVNGLIVGCLRLPAMLVTLCSLQLYNGLAYGITGGPGIKGMCAEFQQIANGTIPATQIPWVLPIFLLALAAVWFFLKHTVAGQEIYFLGANYKTSVFSGIRTRRITVLTYMISGILGSISGILITSHLNCAKVSNGVSYTLLSVLVVVLGGVHPNGGRGKLFGVTLSILLMQMISNAFTIMHASQDAKNFANGCLLIAALLIPKLVSSVRQRQRSRAA